MSKIVKPGDVSVAKPALEKEILETPFCRFRLREGFYTIENFNDMVVILPIVRDVGVVLVRVRRPTIGDAPLEIPGGGRNAKETPLDAARRELKEETGIGPVRDEDFIELPPMAEDTTRRPELTYVFLATVSRDDYEARTAHDDEVMAVELWSFDEVINGCVDGRIFVAPTVSVIARAKFSGHF